MNSTLVLWSACCCVDNVIPFSFRGYSVMFINEPQPHKLRIVQRHITQTPSTKNPRPKNHITDRIPKTPTLKPPYMKKNEERNKEKSTLGKKNKYFSKTYKCLLFRRGRLSLSSLTVINEIDNNLSHYFNALILLISDYCQWSQLY